MLSEAELNFEEMDISTLDQSILIKDIPLIATPKDVYYYFHRWSLPQYNKDLVISKASWVTYLSNEIVCNLSINGSFAYNDEDLNQLLEINWKQVVAHFIETFNWKWGEHAFTCLKLHSKSNSSKNPRKFLELRNFDKNAIDYAVKKWEATSKS